MKSLGLDHRFDQSTLRRLSAESKIRTSPGSDRRAAGRPARTGGRSRSLFLILGVMSMLIQSASAKSFQIQRWQTNKGAQVVFYQAMEVPMLDIRVAFAAGSAYDGKKFGLSALTAEMLNQGNGGLTAGEIAEKLADTGAQYNADTSRDMSVFNLRTLSSPEAMTPAVQLFTLILNRPDFPENEFERQKKQQIMSVIRAKDSPNELANRAFFKKLYGTHPYAHAIAGEQKTLKPLTTKEVKQFYQQYFTNENATVVLVGAIDEKTAHQIAEQIMAELPRIPKAKPIPSAHPTTRQGQRDEIPFPSSQTVLRLGSLGISHHTRHYFPLIVGNYSLGGGALVSRLVHEVREKRGLTYGVYSQFIPMPGIGPFLISLSTVNQAAPTAMRVVRETLSKFVQAGPSEAELSAAKQYLTGSFPLSLSSNNSIAEMLLKIAFYQLPDDYLETYVDQINAVTQAEVTEAFQKTIHPDNLLFVSVGKR